ncbi:MAG: dihydroneopterin aldolase [Proteobacteria bacterium]|nr:dihydroneopterin aldolase [Pseudomonadota bacterium]
MKTSEILIKDLKFYGFHGVYPEEQVVGTTFRVDAQISIDPELKGFGNDQLEDTLNYELLVEKLLEIGTTHKYRLIERLADEMARAMLGFAHVRAVDITVYKSVNRLTPEPQWIGIRRSLEASDV